MRQFEPVMCQFFGLCANLGNLCANFSDLCATSLPFHTLLSPTTLHHPPRKKNQADPQVRLAFSQNLFRPKQPIPGVP